GQGRGQAVCVVRQGAARIRTLRDWPLGHARQELHRDDPSGRGRPGDAAAVVCQRGAFDRSQYKDDVAERIEAAVQQKVEGEQITLAEEPEGGAQIIDLMEALRAS